MENYKPGKTYKIARSNIDLADIHAQKAVMHANLDAKEYKKATKKLKRATNAALSEPNNQMLKEKYVVLYKECVGKYCKAKSSHAYALTAIETYEKLYLEEQ